MSIAVIHGFVTEAEEALLVYDIGWTRQRPIDTRNRIERYGAHVPYDDGLQWAEIPPRLSWLCDRLAAQKLFGAPITSVSVNEYRVGQGLAYHTDNDESGDVIATLGLAGYATLTFRENPNETIRSIPFPRRALVLLQGSWRWSPWQHAIEPVIEDRISIVFRSEPGVRAPL